MEYSYKVGDKLPHNFKCKDEEADAVRAMYIEETVGRIKTGNTQFVSGFEEYVAKSADEDEVSFSFRLANVDAFADKLEAFSDRTEEQMHAIANLGSVADFENTAAIRRMSLGVLAAQLALEVRRTLTDSDAEVTQQVRELRREIDERFSG